jgi:serine/threonine protein kinase
MVNRFRRPPPVQSDTANIDIHPLPARPVEFRPAAVEQFRTALLANGYVMVEILGQGGFSVVYRVHSTRYNRDFAAKITDVSKRASNNEQRALEQLSHPNIVKLYGRFSSGHFCFLILELCCGGSIRSLIRQSKGRPVPHMYRLILQISDAMLYVHSHFIAHRDIKPANILLDDSGTPKIADFGMAEFCRQDTELTDFAGSAQYCAPEVLKRGPYDPFKADIWALGVTFYEMAVGKIQWPDDLEAIVQSIIEGGLLIKQDTPPAIGRMARAMTRMVARTRPMIDDVRTVYMASEEFKVAAKGRRTRPEWAAGVSTTQRMMIRSADLPAMSKARQQSCLLLGRLSARQCTWADDAHKET